jgi:hypothetical protein
MLEMFRKAFRLQFLLERDQKYNLKSSKSAWDNYPLGIEDSE